MGIRSLRTASIFTGTKRSKAWDQVASLFPAAITSFAMTSWSTGLPGTSGTSNGVTGLSIDESTGNAIAYQDGYGSAPNSTAYRTADVAGGAFSTISKANSYWAMGWGGFNFGYFWSLGGAVDAYHNDAYDTVKYYNYSTNTWASGTSLPQASNRGSSRGIGNRLYGFLGAKYGPYCNNLYWLTAYNSAWTTSAALPAQSGQGAAGDGNSSYVLFMNGFSTAASYRYDVASNTWSSALSGAYGQGSMSAAGDGYRYVYTYDGTSGYRFELSTSTYSTVGSQTGITGAPSYGIDYYNGKLYNTQYQMKNG